MRRFCEALRRRCPLLLAIFGALLLAALLTLLVECLHVPPPK